MARIRRQPTCCCTLANFKVMGNMRVLGSFRKAEAFRTGITLESGESGTIRIYERVTGVSPMLFFLLANLTDDGLQACVENPDAFADACDSVRVPGAELLARYATLGQYDFVVMVEADSAQTMSRLSVVLGANGHVHVESMQAITAHLMSDREEALLHGGTGSEAEPAGAAG